MKPEIEVKFININIDAMRQTLTAAGAQLEQPMRPMRRVLIEQPEHAAEHSFIRIRDQGDKTTLCFKRRSTANGLTIDDTQEIEVEVEDFDTTVELLKQAGWPPKTYQENRRETWNLHDVEIVIDEWPWIPPQIEIEGPDEAAVKDTAETLGLVWTEAHFGHIDHIYQEYYTFAPGFRGVIDLAEVRFDNPLPKQMLEKKD
jgi:adenylate cyclase, class 2